MNKKDGGPDDRVEIGFYIPTIDGRVAVVSAEDYARLQGLLWRVGQNGYIYRVGARKKGEPCLMHRIVMGAQAGQEVHHGPGGKLNNMRSNLEVTTPSEHQNHHKHLLIARNRAARKHEIAGICKACGAPFIKDPNHRGRQVCCSKKCGVILAVRGHKEKAHARHR